MLDCDWFSYVKQKGYDHPHWGSFVWFISAKGSSKWRLEKREKEVGSSVYILMLIIIFAMTAYIYS